MAYFAREINQPSPRRGRHSVVHPIPEERVHGVRRTSQPTVEVQRGETRDERLEREREVFQARADGGYLAKFSESREHTSEDMQQRHPAIRKQLESHVFDPSQVEPASKPRLHRVSEEALRQIQPPPDRRKDEASARISEGPTMVERMLGNNYPTAHPVHNEFAGRRFQPEFAQKRNASQIAIGGYHQLPPEPFVQYPGARRSVQVDYSTYIPDRIQPKRYYAVDGRMVDGGQEGPLVKNFFSDEPLLCSKFISNGNAHAAPSPPIGVTQDPTSARQPIPEPPHRRAPFDHGHKGLY